MVSRSNSDTAKVAALGLGHSAAYLLGTLVLGRGVATTDRARILPARVPPGAGGLGRPRRRSRGWWRTAIAPSGRLADLLVLAAIGAVGLGLYFLLLRMLPERGSHFQRAFEPVDPDLAVEP